MIARIYSLTTDARRRDEACSALDALADLIAGIEGCLGAEAFQEVADPDRLVFIERWISSAAYEAAKGMIPSDAFAKLSATLAARPQVSELASLTGEADT